MERFLFVLDDELLGTLNIVGESYNIGGIWLIRFLEI